MVRAVLLGPPGSGKGTQAILLCEKFNAVHLSTGDILRRHVREGTPLGMEAREYMERGELVPDRVVNEMVEHELDGLSDRGFVLDGYPRTVGQAGFLEKTLARRGIPLTLVLYLDVPHREVIERLSARRVCPNCGATYNMRLTPPREDQVCDRCGSRLVQRPDDRAEVVERRLEVYEEETRPLLEFYGQRCLLERVPALGTVEDVFRRVAQVVEARCGSSPS